MGKRSHCLLLSGAVAVASFLAAGPAQAQSLSGGSALCGEGDATSIINAFPDLFDHQKDSTADLSSLCQFRTFEGAPPGGICFREHEVFVGATVWFESAYSSDFADYLDPSGNPWTPRESVAAMTETFTVEPADTPFTTFVTPVKSADSDTYGLTVWKQTGLVFRDLPPGDYTVTMEWHHPVFAQLPDTGNYPSLAWFYPRTVKFHVLSDDDVPRDDHGVIVRPTDRFAGSVECPEGYQ